MKRDYLLAIAIGSLLVLAPSAMADVLIPTEADNSDTPAPETPSPVQNPLRENFLKNYKFNLKNLPVAQQKQIEEADPTYGLDLTPKRAPLDFTQVDFSKYHFDSGYHPTDTSQAAAQPAPAENPAPTDQHVLTLDVTQRSNVQGLNFNLGLFTSGQPATNIQFNDPTVTQVEQLQDPVVLAHIIAEGKDAAFNSTPAAPAPGTAPASVKTAVIVPQEIPAAAPAPAPAQAPIDAQIFAPNAQQQPAHRFTFNAQNFVQQGPIPLNNQAGIAVPQEIPPAVAPEAAPQVAAAPAPDAAPVAQTAANPAAQSAPAAATAPAPQQPSLADEVSSITDVTSSLPRAMDNTDKQSCKGLDTRGTDGLFEKGAERLSKIEDIVKRIEKRSSFAKAAAPGDINAIKLKDATLPGDMALKAKCMMVIPDEISGGLGGVEGEYGAGAYTCKDASGKYGPYHFKQLRGANLGFQIGAKVTNRVLFFMNPDAEAHLQSLDVKVGVRAGAAAGPFGRDGSVSTRWNFKDQIYSYSESTGLYAGISLEGAVFTSDKNMDAVMAGGGVTKHKHNWLGFIHFGHRNICEAVSDQEDGNPGQQVGAQPAAQVVDAGVAH